MSRDLTYIGGYLPLFAGSEVVRRSGALTQFPVDGLLGNLPPLVGDIWRDEFLAVGSRHNILSHTPEVYPNGGQAYSSANTLQYVDPGTGSMSSVGSAIDWYNTTPFAVQNKPVTFEIFAMVVALGSYDFQVRAINGVSGGDVNIVAPGSVPAFRVTANQVRIGNTVVGSWPYDVGNVIGSLITINPLTGRVYGNWMGYAFDYIPSGPMPQGNLTFHFGNSGISMSHLRIYQ